MWNVETKRPDFLPRTGMRLRLGIIVIGCVLGGNMLMADVATVLYDDRVTRVERTLEDPNDLWVVPEDLPRVNDFELKPEGACLDDLCVPVRQDRDSAIFVTRQDQAWLNVTELARRIHQPYAVDHDHAVWSLGQVPAARTRFLNGALAPDFELPNRQGEMVRLSDFRGRKVLLVTWASW